MSGEKLLQMPYLERKLKQLQEGPGSIIHTERVMDAWRTEGPEPMKEKAHGKKAKSRNKRKARREKPVTACGSSAPLTVELSFEKYPELRSIRRMSEEVSHGKKSKGVKSHAKRRKRRNRKEDKQAPPRGDAAGPSGSNSHIDEKSGEIDAAGGIHPGEEEVKGEKENA